MAEAQRWRFEAIAGTVYCAHSGLPSRYPPPEPGTGMPATRLPQPHLPVEKDDSAVVANIPVHHRPENRREGACLQISLHKSTASRGSGANYRVRCSLLCVYRCTPMHTQVDTEGHPYPAPPCFLVLTFTLDFVCVHSCMHVCMCTHRYACICLYTHIYIHAYTNLCAYVYVCPHALVHVCTDLLELQLQVVGTYK